MSEAIKNMISDLIGAEKFKISFDESTELCDELAINSFEMMQLVYNLEEYFKINIPKSDYEQFKIVDDVIKYVSREVN